MREAYEDIHSRPAAEEKWLWRCRTVAPEALKHGGGWRANRDTPDAGYVFKALSGSNQYEHLSMLDVMDHTVGGA